MSAWRAKACLSGRAGHRQDAGTVRARRPSTSSHAWTILVILAILAAMILGMSHRHDRRNHSRDDLRRDLQHHRHSLPYGASSPFTRRSTNRPTPASRRSQTTGLRQDWASRGNWPSADDAQKSAREHGTGDQSDATNRPGGDQGDADVADDGVLSAGTILLRGAKKISTSEHPVWLYG